MSNFPKELTETLATTLASNVYTEIYFGEDGNPSYVELEEHDYDDQGEKLAMNNLLKIQNFEYFKNFTDLVENYST